MTTGAPPVAAPAAPAAVEPLGKHTLTPPRIIGVGTAVTGNSYEQRTLLDLFGITDPRTRSVFLNSAIERRHLTLPPREATGAFGTEPQGKLLAKHKRLALDMGARAVRQCLADAGLTLADIDYLCVVTTTGLLTPGLSAHLMREMGISSATSRMDVVGMGCNAGLNALNALSSWATANPGRVAVMLCVEACSAAYVMDATMRTAVVNSLFGDGAAAIALLADPPDAAGPSSDDLDPSPAPVASAGPRLLGFASHLIDSAIDAMRYDWDDDQHKFSFYLDPDIPYVVGANAEQVVDRLLSAEGLRRSHIAHWLVHSGGKKVIDAVRVNLGLTRHDLRHTSGVLRDYGNLSSGSFLFSYERLMRERVVRAGEFGVLMTMGPGSTIETALVQW
ncbi:polyketide synthase Type III [Streptomyces sp. SAI-117]|uniref:3,5-dihydroxyphenylacetyl-CoA synthase DpgA n=1 Tax=unclassified Streptomyces TaxID=2593676 RepID=UPI002475927C|nr:MULTISPECIES: 3,5-dihydroxyphenylacetyl-CoA synthase DpgA [unclassified Streptomyces]MDH6553823.1 polyketide synthase Type III [Streptomyces sp. SAI-041]MDH6572901.1 polyketide synthase Type III [Streptomyces sp. SAI-117]MDH6582137.1 polyketide synthase Type III [Streptomyces sp. SAI-133]